MRWRILYKFPKMAFTKSCPLDFTLDEVADTLQVPIDIVKSSGQDFVNAILGIDTRRNRDKQNVKDRRIESV